MRDIGKITINIYTNKTKGIKNINIGLVGHCVTLNQIIIIIIIIELL